MCGGKRRGEGTGMLCTRPAGWGTDHPGSGRCKLHGGKTPSHERAGQRARAEQAVATLGLPREVTRATRCWKRCTGPLARWTG